VQHVCAEILGCDFNRADTVVRRLGGGFGGKESAPVGRRRGRAGRRQDRPAGKSSPAARDRHDRHRKRRGFDYRHTVGFDGEGRVLALDAVLAADAGWVPT
jgi:xanthine dehydrogenase large subunit